MQQALETGWGTHHRVRDHSAPEKSFWPWASSAETGKARSFSFLKFYWSTVDSQFVLIYAVQQSDSFIYIYTYIHIYTHTHTHTQAYQWLSSKESPAMWEIQVRFLGQEDPMEEGMAIHSSILAWRIPWTEEPGRLKSMWSQRVGHDWQHACMCIYI